MSQEIDSQNIPLVQEAEDYDTDDQLWTTRSHDGKWHQDQRQPRLGPSASRHFLTVSLGVILSLSLLVLLAVVSSEKGWITYPTKQCVCQESHYCKLRPIHYMLSSPSCTPGY